MAELILDWSWADGATNPTDKQLAEMWLASKASYNCSLLHPPSIWDLPTVLKEESFRVGLHLAAVGPLYVTLQLFLRDLTLL